MRVYSDSVLCLVKMSDPSEANRRWEGQVADFQLSDSYEELLRIDGETIEFDLQRHRMDKIRERRELHFTFRKSQDVREEILAGTLDVPLSWRGKEVVWKLQLQT